ncbi:hypothetical protein AB1N83_009920 [Pleurotus pulmonarius]
MEGREGIPEIIVDPPSANPLAIKAPTVPDWEAHVATGVLVTELEALTLRALFGSQVIGIRYLLCSPQDRPPSEPPYRIAHGSGDGVRAWEVSPFTRINQRNYPFQGPTHPDSESSAAQDCFCVAVGGRGYALAMSLEPRYRVADSSMTITRPWDGNNVLSASVICEARRGRVVSADQGGTSQTGRPRNGIDLPNLSWLNSILVSAGLSAPDSLRLSSQ